MTLVQINVNPWVSHMPAYAYIGGSKKLLIHNSPRYPTVHIAKNRIIPKAFRYSERDTWLFHQHHLQGSRITAPSTNAHCWASDPLPRFQLIWIWNGSTSSARSTDHYKSTNLNFWIPICFNIRISSRAPNQSANDVFLWKFPQLFLLARRV